MVRAASAALDVDERPAWVLDAPRGKQPPPPVVTRAQVLPFSALDWQDFERLCLRVSRLDGVPETWRLFGTAGQAQGGIDIFVRQRTSNKYWVWQAKRHKTFTAAKVKAAVKVFLEGEWPDKSERFAICTATSLRSEAVLTAIEEEAAVLGARGITLEIFDEERLSEVLKAHPDIVNDFFDRPWVERFCGADAAVALGKRLSRTDLSHLRSQLASLYATHFSAVDPGVLRATGAGPRGAIGIVRRFVAPDLFATVEPGDRDARSTLDVPELELTRFPDASSANNELRPAPRSGRPSRQRVPLSRWSGDIERAVVVGAPGAGKSTLLRFIALDALSDNPQLSGLRERYPSYIPVWLSFPFWTRQIQGHAAGEAISIERAVTNWLQAQDESPLVDLVLQAFEDGRVMLLVDGIDEWVDVAAATTAVGLLRGFVERRRIPVVVSSRPNGVRVLQSLDASWRRFDLAPLSIDQQVDFATPWFELVLAEQGIDASTARTRAVGQSDAFVAELQRASEIAALAETPLLLGGLLALKLSGAILPRSRWRAYAELCARLLDSHPAARDQAAFLSQSRTGLDRETRELVLASLAFEVQARSSTDLGIDAINVVAAVRHCKTYLIANFEFEPAEADRHARNLIDVGESAIGILVKKSHAEIGFLHRALQEYLAAKHVAGLDLDEQLALVGKHASDSRWRDVLLFAVQSSQRPSEVERLVEVIERAAQEEKPVGVAASLLLADVSFSDVRRFPATTRRLARRFFAEIETGPDVDMRANLLRRAISGVASSQTSPEVRPKLRQWFPQWHSYSLPDALRIISDWEEGERIDSILWRNLHSDIAVVRRQAARSLANRNAGDDACHARLRQLLHGAGSGQVVAAALTAIGEGWKSVSGTAQLMDEASCSEDRFVALAGIGGRIVLGRHSAEDRERLLSWLYEDNWEHREAIADALVRGWSGSDELKKSVLKRRDRGYGRDEDLLSIGIRAFPGDDAIAEAIVELVFADGRDFGIRDDWDALAKNFFRHPVLIDALETHVGLYAKHSYELSKAANIAPTQILKCALLEDLADASSLNFWSAETLAEHWGVGDGEVATALGDVMKRQLDGRDQLSRLYPKLVADRERCRSLLLEIVREQPNNHRLRSDFALEALKQIGVTGDDREAFSLAMKLDFFSDYYLTSSNAIRVLHLFPDEPKVLDLARRHLRHSEGLIGAIALCLGHHSDIRAAVLDVAAPLQDELREVIVEGLGSHAAEDCDVFDLLSEAPRETSRDVAAAAQVAIARTRRASGTVDDEYLKGLVKELHAIGPRMDARRAGALAALLMVRRGDLFASEREAGDEPLKLRLFRYDRQSDERVVSVLVKHWSELEELLGDDIASRLELDDETIVGSVGAELDLSSVFGGYARKALARLASKPLSAAALRFAVRSAPSTDVLDLCLSNLNRDGSWLDVSAAMTAAEIIAHEYSDSEYAFKSVVESVKARRGPGALSALCEGWPNSAEMNDLYDAFAGKELPERWRLTPLIMKVGMQKSAAAGVMRQLVDATLQMSGHLWEGPQYWVPSAVRRIQSDPEVTEGLMACLRGSPSGGQRVSFVSLLHLAHGATDDLLDWCRSEFLRSAQHEVVPIFGMDISRGKMCSVRERLGALVKEQT